MRTKDHRNLGKYLLRELEVSGVQRAAFLWGSIQPDVNCLSHFSGLSVKGHHCASCTVRIEKLLRRIKEKRDSAFKYYMAGKLMHYLADSFTFTHNDFFSGSLREHVMYEHMLSRRLECVFEDSTERDMNLFPGIDIMEILRNMHRQYVESRRSELDDIRYIVEAALAAMHISMKSRPH